MKQNLKWYTSIIKSLINENYNDLGTIRYEMDDDITKIIIKIIPHEGVHKDIEYILTLKYRKDSNENTTWPGIYVDSLLFDKIKTDRYLKNNGKNGEHKGICIEKLSYGYAFKKNFNLYCSNKWENHVYYVINILNNLQDFNKGNGIKKDYKEILKINE